MCAFKNVDECYHDYAVFTSRRTPNLVNPSDVYQAVNENLSHYATDPSYTSKVNSLIRNNNLTYFTVIYCFNLSNLLSPIPSIFFRSSI